MIASCIKGKSKIWGIKNQKVKECNRIKALIKNFQKIGIFCEELDDGIIIHGKDVVASKAPVFIKIKTYNDHRIAMSFSVLASFYFKQ